MGIQIGLYRPPRNASGSTAPEAALAEDMNVLRTGLCEGKGAIGLYPTEKATPSVTVPIKGGVMLTGESGSEAQIKEMALPMADRAKQREI